MTDEGFMVFPFNFISPVNIEIEEVSQGVALIKGILLVEGISRNKNLYTIEEMESIAERTIGVPIHFGVTTKINPNTGLLTKNLHDDSNESQVGKILQTFLDKINRKITFIGEVVNTEQFPDLISKIRKGWGISVGGFVTKANYVVDKIKGIVLKIKDLIVEHVTIVPPTIVRGQDEAQIDSVNIQETMIFGFPEEIIEIKIGKGVKVTEIKCGNPVNIKLSREE